MGLLSKSDTVVCVVGLGYVGLPLAVAFGKTEVEAHGFDVNSKKIAELKEGVDSMGEVSREELAATRHVAGNSKLRTANWPPGTRQNY